jgi:hypothetical protein
MRTLWALISMGVLLNAATAVAATELEMFEKKVGAYAVAPLEVFHKSKGLCVCINDPYNFWNVGAAGILNVQIFTHTGTGTPPTPPGRVYVSCVVMMAEANGDITQGAACPEWVPLSK